MTTREWNLSVLLISVVQGAIWYAAFVNAGNSSALNYVSFAGTLISIVLAVLAIGYTYGESVIQRGQGNSLAAQIAALSEVAKGIKVQAESLGEISRIKAGLADVAKTIELGFSETKDRVSGMTERIDAVKQRVDAINLIRETPVKESRVDKTEAAHSFMAARMPLMEISLLIVVALSKKDPPSLGTPNIRKTIREYMERANKKMPAGSARELDEMETLFSGSVHTLISMLSGFGLMHYTGRTTFSLEKALITELSSTTFKSPTSAGPFYTALRDELLEDVK